MANGTGKLIQHRFTVHPLFYLYSEDEKVFKTYSEGISIKTDLVASQYTITILKDMIDMNFLLINKETGETTIDRLNVDVVYQYLTEKRYMRKEYEVRKSLLFSEYTKKASPHLLFTPYYFPLYINWLKTNAEILFSLSAYSSEAHQEEYRKLLDKWNTLLANFENGDMSLIDDVEYNNTPDKIREIYLPTVELEQENNRLQEQLLQLKEELYNAKNTLSQYEAIPELKKRIKDDIEREINEKIRQRTSHLQERLTKVVADNESLTYFNKSLENELKIANKNNIDLKQEYESQIEELKKQHAQEKEALGLHIKSLEIEKEGKVSEDQHIIEDIQKQLENVTYSLNLTEKKLERAQNSNTNLEQQGQLQINKIREEYRFKLELQEQYIIKLKQEMKDMEYAYQPENKKLKESLKLTQKQIEPLKYLEETVKGQQREHMKLSKEYDKLVKDFTECDNGRRQYLSLLKDPERLREFYLDQYKTPIEDDKGEVQTIYDDESGITMEVPIARQTKRFP